MRKGWILLVLLLGTCVGCAGPAVPPAASQPAPAVGVWRDLLDGKTLAGWKVTPWDGAGKVYVKDGAVHLEAGATTTGITFTGDVPRENYEIELEAMRVAGDDFFAGLTFPVGKDFVSLIPGGWSGAVTGLSCLDYHDASDNETTQTVGYANGRWYHLRVRVTSQRIQAWIDGERVVDVERGEHKISVRLEVEESIPLGVATWKTHGAIREMRIRNLPEH